MLLELIATPQIYLDFKQTCKSQMCASVYRQESHYALRSSEVSLLQLFFKSLGHIKNNGFNF